MSHDDIYNLKEFLLSCDDLSDFNSLEHIQYHTALGIVSGLHNNGVAHRDLKPKPENVLV